MHINKARLILSVSILTYIGLYAFMSYNGAMRWAGGDLLHLGRGGRVKVWVPLGFNDGNNWNMLIVVPFYPAYVIDRLAFNDVCIFDE